MLTSDQFYLSGDGLSGDGPDAAPHPDLDLRALLGPLLEVVKARQLVRAQDRAGALDERRLDLESARHEREGKYQQDTLKYQRDALAGEREDRQSRNRREWVGEGRQWADLGARALRDVLEAGEKAAERQARQAAADRSYALQEKDQKLREKKEEFDQRTDPSQLPGAKLAQEQGIEEKVRAGNEEKFARISNLLGKAQHPDQLDEAVALANQQMQDLIAGQLPEQAKEFGRKVEDKLLSKKYYDTNWIKAAADAILKHKKNMYGEGKFTGTPSEAAEWIRSGWSSRNPY